jgi:deoxyribonuclease-4
VENAPLNAREIDAGAFAMFTRNQRQWKAKPYTAENIRAFQENCGKGGYQAGQILVHDSYLINLGSPEAEGLKKSRAAFLEEMQRCEQLGLTLLNFHPGSHLGKSSEKECLKRIAESVNLALSQTRGVTAVLEITAGMGNHVGYRFEQLAEVIEQVEDKSRAGVCVDTCHAFAAGYDLRTRESFENVIDQLDAIVGLEYLKGWHFNDAKAGLGSRLDRHESIGKGRLGIEAFRLIMNDPRFEEMPMILETPRPDLWPEEIRLLQDLIE